MGKTTLFHPVSLHVVRGAASYGGFAFGRISQTGADPARCTARYKAELVTWPAGFERRPQARQQAMLDACFLADIRITWVGRNVRGKLSVNFTTVCGSDTESSDTPELNADLEGGENA